MVAVVDVPEEELTAGTHRDTGSVVGKVTRLAIADGEQLTAANVERTGNSHVDRFVPLKRAMTINIAPLTSDGAPVFPGDHVDIAVERDNSPATLLANLEIIAIGVPTMSDPVGSATNGDSATVTLAVEPGEAQLLAEAMESGAKFKLSHSA
jgi:Flp pilus assembly protein CpaB